MDKYDVVVIGGGTAGCAAAYNAGICGLKTLLVEKSVHLGGAITSGLVIPAMKSSDNQINTDFFNELINELKSLGGQVTYQGNPGWFNPELTKIALDRLMNHANVEVMFNTSASEVIFTQKDSYSEHQTTDASAEINPSPIKRNTESRTIKSLILSSNLLSVCIAASYVVDATGNCEIFELANCNFISENEKKFQPVSLRFEMAGVDLNQFSNWILDYDSDRNVTSSEFINGQIHFSTAYTDSGKWALEPIFNDAIASGVLNASDCKYFQLFSIAGMPNSVSFNCPRIHLDSEIAPLEASYISKALQIGRESIFRLANFCKIYFPGFKNAYISNIADALGVRVSRRILGKYVYTEDDLKSGKKFANPVLIGNYPIDIHSNIKGESVLEHTTQDYQLPIEALMSADINNLFVAGRGLSADFKAQAALRIQPSCFAMGEGVAKYLAGLKSQIEDI